VDKTPDYLSIMGRAFRWILAFLATLVCTALIQPLLEKIFARAGWYDAPSHAVGLAVNWLEQIIGVAPFPWIAAGTIGLAVGTWADNVLRRLDGRHPIGKVARGRAIAPTLEALAHRIDFALRGPFPSTGQYPSLFSEVEVITLKLKKLGIATPPKVAGDDAASALRRISAWLKFSAPLLRDGQLDRARSLIKFLNDGMEPT
jgi:hypothetical protein